MASPAKTTPTKADPPPDSGLVVHWAQLAEIILDPENQRRHDERNIALIVASLSDHGQTEPLVVQQSSHRIIAGNGRRLAMERLGWDRCQVVWLDVDDTTARAISLRMNRTAETASWEETLAEALTSLADADFDVDALGWSNDELDALFAAKGEKEEAETAGKDVELKSHTTKPPPKMAWVLIGIPIARYGEIDRQIRALAKVPGVLCETATASFEPETPES